VTVAGDLTERIYLQQRDPAVGALREQAKSWVMFTPNGIWSSRPFAPRGREFFAGGQEQAEATLAFRIRYRTDVTTKMRLLHNGQPYDITVINPVRGGKEFVDLICKAGVRDGRVTS